MARGGQGSVCVELWSGSRVRGARCQHRLGHAPLSEGSFGFGVELYAGLKVKRRMWAQNTQRGRPTWGFGFSAFVSCSSVFASEVFCSSDSASGSASPLARLAASTSFASLMLFSSCGTARVLNGKLRELHASVQPRGGCWARV